MSTDQNLSESENTDNEIRDNSLKGASAIETTAKNLIGYMLDIVNIVGSFPQDEKIKIGSI